MEKLKSRTITVYPQQWEKFGKICDTRGYDRSKLIRIWMDRFISKININI